jgi:hypothetical protein
VQALVGAIRKFWWAVKAHFLTGEGDAVDGTGGSGGVVDNCHSHRLRRLLTSADSNSHLR